MQRLFDFLFFHEEINGGDRCPTYLHRWHLLRLPRKMRVYLHKFVASDWSRDHHDHPKRFISIGLKGRYREEILDPQSDHIREVAYVAPWIRTFRASHIHRLRMIPGETCWTIVFTFPEVREWGFWVKGKWTHWKEYVYGSLAEKGADC